MIQRYLKAFVTLALLYGVSTHLFANTSAKGVVHHYADMALAEYSDALTMAKKLDTAIDAFLADTTAVTLQKAKHAWLAARIPYMQTEVYRFGNVIVDDWEVRVNSWPLDEGLIDYVDTSYGYESDENPLYTADIIANTSFMVDGKKIDASVISVDVLHKLQEAGGIEANVATGYHAIEFLLWGQDLNGTGPGSGNRPYTDFSLTRCTHGNCDRRRQYLAVVTDLLVTDLEEMVADWRNNGAARKALFAGGVNRGLSVMLTGMGSLSYGELAGERMKLGLLLGDPEEEHDCFSDNTHNSHYYDALGIQNVYLGTYTRLDGTVMQGPSLSDLIVAVDKKLDGEVRSDLKSTMRAMKVLVDRAETKEAYDQMIASGNEEGNDVVQDAIDGLLQQARSFQRVVATLDLEKIEFERSDSLDNPSALFE